MAAKTWPAIVKVAGLSFNIVFSLQKEVDERCKKRYHIVVREMNITSIILHIDKTHKTSRAKVRKETLRHIDKCIKEEVAPDHLVPVLIYAFSDFDNVCGEEIKCLCHDMMITLYSLGKQGNLFAQPKARRFATSHKPALQAWLQTQNHAEILRMLLELKAGISEIE